VSVIEIDIDDETLAIAMRHLGTRSPQDAVNSVLREYVKWAGQGEAAERDLRR
jgi:Arc/MetJ family transcription regulator